MMASENDSPFLKEDKTRDALNIYVNEGLVDENEDENFDDVDEEVGARGIMVKGTNETPFGTFEYKTHYAENKNEEEMLDFLNDEVVAGKRNFGGGRWDVWGCPCCIYENEERFRRVLDGSSVAQQDEGCVPSKMKAVSPCNR